MFPASNSCLVHAQNVEMGAILQVQRNAGAMGWRLDENEVEIIRERLAALENGDVE